MGRRRLLEGKVDAATLARALQMGVKRTQRGHRETDANDPQRTLARRLGHGVGGRSAELE
jgi:hypothetical protein